MPKLSKPSREYLLDLKSELMAQYAGQDQQIDRMRRLRELTFDIPLDEELRLCDIEVRDPAVSDEHMRVTATLSVNPPTISVKPNKLTDSAEKNARIREKWTWGVFEQAGGRQSPTTYQRVIDAAVEGGAWCKLLFSKDLWENRYSIKPGQFLDAELQDSEEEDDEDVKVEKAKDRANKKYLDATEDAKKVAGVPFEWILVDTKSVYPVWKSPGRVREILEVSTRPRSSTYRNYRLGESKDGEIVPEELASPQDDRSVGRALGSTVQVLEHWDDTWCTIFITNDKSSHVVKQWKHGYGRVPYFFAPGLYMGSHWSNRKIGWGVGESKAYLVALRSFLWTVLANMTARDAIPPVFREMAVGGEVFVGDDGKPKSAEKWNLRGIYEGKPGERLYPFQFPTTPQSVNEMIAVVSKAIDDLMTPKVRSEIGGGLEGAGFAINQILAEARIRHDPIAQGVERMLKDMTDFTWHLVRTKIKEDVWVYVDGDKDSGWLVAGPDDLLDSVSYSWTVNSETPSAEMLKNRYASERLQNGTWSIDRAIEFLGDNPDEIREEKTMDRMRNMPYMQQFQDAAVMAELGRGDILKQAFDAQMAAQTGNVPPSQGGMPGPQGGMPMGGGIGGGPDIGNLAASPGGVGAAPVAPPGQPGGGPPPGINFGPQPPSGPGMPSGPSLIGRSVAPALQNMGA